jgi:hypothetical protein
VRVPAGAFAEPTTDPLPGGATIDAPTLSLADVRDNYVNVCDITPTIYDLLDIAPPDTVKGIEQKPLDGVSFKAALDDPSAGTGKQTQFYTMLSTRGIWHQGWFASTVHPAAPSDWSHFDQDRWELYRIENDRNQCHDLAAEHPDKLAELQALWFSEAERYNGLPLSDLNVFEMVTRSRPSLVGDRSRFIYYPNTAPVSMGAFTFGLAGGGVSVGRNPGEPVSTAYRAPCAFSGGVIRRVVVDVSGTPYRDAEHELAAAFAKD